MLLFTLSRSSFCCSNSLTYLRNWICNDWKKVVTGSGVFRTCAACPWSLWSRPALFPAHLSDGSHGKEWIGRKFNYLEMIIPTTLLQLVSQLLVLHLQPVRQSLEVFVLHLCLLQLRLQLMLQLPAPLLELVQLLLGGLCSLFPLACLSSPIPSDQFPWTKCKLRWFLLGLLSITGERRCFITRSHADWDLFNQPQHQEGLGEHQADGNTKTDLGTNWWLHKAPGNSGFLSTL